MLLTSRRAAASIGVGMLLMVAVWTAWGQETPPAASAPAPTTEAAPAEAAQAEGKDVEALWTDMIYYMGVARPDVANSYAQALLQKPEAADQVFQLASKNPGAMSTLTRAARDPVLKPSVEKIMALIEKGYMVEYSDPKRIGEAITLLLGDSQNHLSGVDRLKKSGEYALPLLLQKMRAPDTTEVQKDVIAAFLPELKLAAVRPLAESLQSKDPSVVERVAIALGVIGYPHAAPMLKEALDRPDLADGKAGKNAANLRRALETALVACGGQAAARKSAAQLYGDLAEQYYYQAESLQSDPRMETGNVWTWSEDVGLAFKPTPRAIFCDIYAMRCAARALSLDQNLSQAVSLWLAADIKKEADLPAGAKDTITPPDQPPAKFYSLAAGAKYLQEVLARGLSDKNVPVAVGAIEALAQTAGAKSLLIPASGGALPLVDAMSFPDGRVRFLAAVTLASALPQERFVGWEKVLPTLNDAMLMTGGKMRAVLVGDNSELSNKVKGLLRAGGWGVMDSIAAGAAVASAQAVGSVDLIVVVNKEDASAMVRQFRREPTMAKAAVVVVAAESPALAAIAQADKAVKVLPPTSVDDAFTGAFTAAKPAGPGGLSEDQAAQWATRAAQVVGTLADTGNKVLEVQSAIGPLMELLNNKKPEVRLAAASALAVVPTSVAQQAVAKLALATDLDEKVRVAVLNAACGSVRRFGNLFAADQQTGVLDLVTGKGSAELRDAAAQLLGALSLPSDKVKSLILQTGGK